MKEIFLVYVLAEKQLLLFATTPACDKHVGSKGGDYADGNIQYIMRNGTSGV